MPTAAIKAHWMSGNWIGVIGRRIIVAGGNLVRHVTEGGGNLIRYLVEAGSSVTRNTTETGGNVVVGEEDV